MEYPQTAKEQLEKWDAGDSIWMVEMGGLGPGYEQAIQVLAMELVRDKLNQTLPPIGDPAWGSWGDETVSRIDYRKPDGTYACGGFSGAQVGAAKSLALHILRHGPAKAFSDEAGKNRMIQVSRTWPNIPAPK
jgi:hypothetical protein